jgi:hypothetical protein
MIEPNEIAYSVNEGFNILKSVPVQATLQSYVETTNVTGMITADTGNALMGGFSLYCSTFPAAAPVCIPMAIGFIYEWFNLTFAHMF